MTGFPRVAVLGAGIMGCSLALKLARHGARVTLFDAASAPFSGASRWNEGKIHLGYLYNADSSLRTAQHIMPGGLRFRPLVEELIGCSLAPAISADDDIFLCHRDSLVAPDRMESYLQQVGELVRSHPDARHYLHDVRAADASRLSPQELSGLTDSSEILAGFRVPERSVQTNWVADRFVDAVQGEPNIALALNERVLAARPEREDLEGRWQVDTTVGHFGGFDAVVNALWEGRMAVDQTAGIQPAGVWSNRYRQSVFVTTREPLDLPCVVVATGPFGDIKNYDGQHFYLSWYPAGLLADDSGVEPPDPSTLARPDPQVLHDIVFERLEQLLPAAAKIRESELTFTVNGGWVFAAGRGQLSDALSTLHRRSSYGVERRGHYFSVDTGKYATAPLTAIVLSELLAERLA